VKRTTKWLILAAVVPLTLVWSAVVLWVCLWSPLIVVLLMMGFKFYETKHGGAPPGFYRAMTGILEYHILANLCVTMART